MRRKTNLLLSLSLIALFVPGFEPALAGPNDFFGTAVPSDTSAQPEEVNPYASTPMPEGDYSEDERRMQKKFKSRVQHAKNLISKGEKLIERGKSKNDKKLVSRGQIFVDIGNRELKQLAENNPLSNLLTPQQKTAMELKEKEKDKKGKVKTAQSSSTSTQ